MSNANVIFRMMVNKFGADNLGIQNVYTPVNKIEEATGIKFSDYITPEMKNIAVLFNWEFIYTMLEEASKNNYTNDMQFTYFYDSEADKSALNFNGFDKYRFAKVNYKIDFVNISEFTEQNKNINVIEKAMAGKHFDIVFSNPPYGTSSANALDLIILKNCFKNANKIVFIHPSEWFLNKYSKKQIKNELKNSPKLEKISLIWGNGIFNIGIFMPLCISEWNTNKNTNIVKINDIAFSNKSFECNSADFDIHYGNVKDFYNDYVNFISKLKSYDSIYLHRVKADLSDLTDYSIKIANIRGNISANGFSSDFFTYIGLNEKKINYTDKSSYNVKRSRDDERKCWSFENDTQRKNFVSYMKTKIVRFGNSLSKTNQGPSYEFIPWLDFTQEWNDKKLCEEFNISEELWNYIDNFIPDYYEDYDDGFTAKAKTIISRHHGVGPNDEMKKFCPAEVIDYLISTPITNKSGFVIRGFSKEGNYYYAFKEHNNDSDDTTFAWRVYRKAKRK